MGVVVPLEEDRGRGQNAVAQLQALVADEMEAVNEFIRERMSSDVPMIPDLASHLINSGGKRLRPMLTIASSVTSSGADASVPDEVTVCSCHRVDMS